MSETHPDYKPYFFGDVSRGSFFVAPWEFEGEVSTAKATLRVAIEKMGGTVVVDQDRYGGLFSSTCIPLID